MRFSRVQAGVWPVPSDPPRPIQPHLTLSVMDERGKGPAELAEGSLGPNLADVSPLRNVLDVWRPLWASVEVKGLEVPNFSHPALLPGDPDGCTRSSCNWPQSQKSPSTSNPRCIHLQPSHEARFFPLVAHRSAEAHIPPGIQAHLITGPLDVCSLRR